MYASSKSRRSLTVARGPITRVALAPRINGPATDNDWAVICKRGAHCCGTLLRASRFPGGSRAFGRVGACARLESSAVGRKVRGVRRVGCQSRGRARRGGGEDRLTHVVWQRQRSVADAGSYGASRADADSNRRLDELPSDLLPPHARSDGQTRRANRVASRVFENSKLSSSARSLPPL